MARKLPVPEIPPIPSRRSGGGAGTRPVPARIAPVRKSLQPELPDLLEAFLGDGASMGEASETSHSCDRRRVPSDPT